MSKIFLNRSVAKVCRKEGGMVKGFILTQMYFMR